MKIKGFLNDEDEKEVKRFVNNLLKEKKLEETQSIESGGFGVRYDGTYNGAKAFDVYRIVATVTVPKKLKK